MTILDPTDPMRFAFAAKIAATAALTGAVNALMQGQEPLGVEFEAIWDANVDRLYETGDDQ